MDAILKAVVNKVVLSRGTVPMVTIMATVPGHKLPFFFFFQVESLRHSFLISALAVAFLGTFCQLP